MTKFGVAASICYAIHFVFNFCRGQLEDLLWVCHVGAALVAVGLLTSSATVNGLGALFLCLGTPLWLLDVAGGGEFNPTSCFNHLGVFGLGLCGVRRLGMPRGVWLKASVALITLIAFSRLATPAAANVNLAFAIHPGWENRFPSHRVYLATNIAASVGYFFGLERLLRRRLARPHAEKKP